MENSLTAKMKVDVLKMLKEKHMSNVFPYINEWDSYKNYIIKPLPGLPYRETISYIFLLYSVDSILNKDPMPPLEERQMKAADMVKFKRSKDGVFNKQVSDVLFNLKDENLIQMVFQYLIYQNNPDWEEIVMMEKLRYDYLRNIAEYTQHDDPKKVIDTQKTKSFLLDESMKIKKKLKEAYSTLFGEQEQIKEVARQKIVMTVLESFAE